VSWDARDAATAAFAKVTAAQSSKENISE